MSDRAHFELRVLLESNRAPLAYGVDSLRGARGHGSVMLTGRYAAFAEYCKHTDTPSVAFKSQSHFTCRLQMFRSRFRTNNPGSYRMNVNSERTLGPIADASSIASSGEHLTWSAIQAPIPSRPSVLS